MVPDGAVVVYAPRVGRWSCFVEVKTGDDELRPEQIEGYCELALKAGVDAILTISNQITSAPDISPVSLPPRKGKRPKGYPQLFHLSWWRVLAEAVVQHQHRGVSDPDQAWILGELIAYLDHERSGIGGFQDMGPGWVQVREGARNKTLDAKSEAVLDIADRWEQMIEYLGLGLYRDLGQRVETVRPRGETPEGRLTTVAATLANEAILRAEVRVTDAVAPMEITADLRGQKVFTSVEVPAPEDLKRPTARVNWLLRQLAKTDSRDVSVEALFLRKVSTTAPLDAVRERADVLAHPADPRQPPRRLRVTMRREMGVKRAKGPGSFIFETRRQVVDFYREVVQGLTPPPRKAPQLPLGSSSTPEPTSQPPAFSDTSAREAGEGTTPAS